MRGDLAPHTAEHVPRLWQAVWFRMAASVAVMVCAGLLIAGEYILHHAEPLVRKRIIETLSARFDAPVELDRLDISLLKGIEVSGTGLRIPFRAGMPDRRAYPMISVAHFAFRTSLRGLLHQPTRVSDVRVDGMELHVPPPDERRRLLRGGEDYGNPGMKAKIAIVVDQLHCHDVKLFLEPGQPGKDPLLFAISTLELQNVGPGQAMLYAAEIINPKPHGAIQVRGHFGPWAGGAALAASRDPDAPAPRPGQTPIDGDYTFDDADLRSIRGVEGVLSSAGHFAGVLDRITVEGRADVPDFSLDISDRPMPLHTTFHAIVDGTSGDTYLEPVHARLGDSDFTTRGRIVKVKGRGHDIQLEIDIPHGRTQDFLRLAVKTSPPLMNGTLNLQARLHIPPGHERVPMKMEMTGAFHVDGVRFNNARWESRLQGLSARAQRRPEEDSMASRDPKADGPSELSSRFTISGGVMTASDAQYTLPGASAQMSGVYSMDGKLFEFKGHVRTQATASQMVGGWKGLLLQPLDHYLQRNGAGVELPIEVSGTEGDIHFGLALQGVDETPQQMLTEVKAKDQGKRQMSEARRLAAEADAEDKRAASAPTLEAAAEAHRAAVRLRALANQTVTNQGATRTHP